MPETRGQKHTPENTADEENDENPGAPVSIEEKMTKILDVISLQQNFVNSTLAQMQKLSEENHNIYKEMLAMTRENLQLRSAVDHNKENAPPAPARDKNGVEGGRQNQTATNATLNTTHQSPRQKRAARPVRPTVDTEMDDTAWAVFLDSWKRFKRLAEIDDTDMSVIDELRETCSTEVNRLMYDFVGSDELNSPTLSENKLLEFIKSVAVRTIHADVHCWNFNAMAQEQGENVSRFVGRLKAQASLCGFTAKCECNKEVSYSNAMVSQRLTSGLNNPEHQAKLLNEAEQLDTLEKKVHRLVSLETTEDAQGHIRQSTGSSVAAVKSQYKRAMQKPNGREPFKTKAVPSLRTGNNMPRRRIFKKRRRQCRGCGKATHGDSKTMARTDCPAFNHTCGKCGIERHFDEVCESRRSRVSFVCTDDEYFSSDQSDGNGETDCYTSENEASADESSTHATTKMMDFRDAKQRHHLR